MAIQKPSLPRLTMNAHKTTSMDGLDRDLIMVISAYDKKEDKI